VNVEKVSRTMTSKSSIEGQNILVTGGSRGIGAAIVRRLVAEGARPIIHYGRDEASARDLLRDIGEGWIIQADLSDPAAPKTLVEQAIQRAGRLHAVVNNAGIRTEIDIEATVDDWQAAWKKEFQVDVFAAADICRAAILHFKAHGGGRIINMGSRAGQRGYVLDCMPYGAAKAALMNLTKSIARSCGGDGIYAVNIAPGWVRTEMVGDLAERIGIDNVVRDIPIGAMAEPDEVAELVAFALRPSQKSLNGATLDVNGGSYLR
jgi:NAD(P)-dependent dehydrogenase (short-subunit alcohol dehydrogenase family)